MINIKSIRLKITYKEAAWWTRAKRRAADLREKFYTWLAWMLPRELCKWVFSRVVAHAMCRVYPNKQMGEVPVDRILKAWDVRK